ncbi:hypothetical protein MES5069_550128 [Mesorhizobium escarrei]|uniref:Uncharacterized protein n=1 Tax=Mesorhizobium escarrei TaxID=666018 RepID=A0ABN8K9Z1_9HYPH|nr:hypothetical protein MES5069_550128 [Mesorhizobium escarrei]
MHVGGGLKRGKMITARFCSDSCRVASHLRRKRYEARAVAS